MKDSFLYVFFTSCLAGGGGEVLFDLLFVTHDIGTIEHLCEEVGIIKNGKIIEAGLTKTILHDPKEAYTKQLLESGFRQRSFRT